MKRMQLPTRAVSESTALENRDSKTKELPVLSPDGEETNESSNDTQPTTTDTKKSSFHKAIAVIFVWQRSQVRLYMRSSGNGIRDKRTALGTKCVLKAVFFSG